MSDAMLAGALERCLMAIRRGESYESALSRYQELRPELDSLLLTAMRLRPAPALRLSTEARSAGRSHVMEAIRVEPHAAEESRRGVVAILPSDNRPGWLESWRLIFVPAVAAALVAAIMFGLAVTQSKPQAPTSATSMSGTTILTVLEGTVQVETSSGIVIGSNGMRIAAGDRILTGPDARAVLTFFDGSTVVVESDAVVVLTDVAEADGKLQATIRQEQGSTWTHIPQELGQANVEIQTPSARVETSQASVQTTVTGSGATQVGAQSGAAVVQSHSSTTQVPSGYETSVVNSNAVVAAPAPAAKPAQELVLRIDGKVQALLTDPRQASIGVSSGVPVNQISGAHLERGTDVLVLQVPNSADGPYRLLLTATGDSNVVVSVSLRSGASDRIDTSMAMRNGEGIALSFGLVNDDLTLVSSVRTSGPAPVPAAVIIPDKAADKANSISSNPNPGIGSQNLNPALPTQPPAPTSTPRPPATPTRVPPKAGTPSLVPSDPARQQQQISNQSISTN